MDTFDDKSLKKLLKTLQNAAVTEFSGFGISLKMDRVTDAPAFEQQGDHIPVEQPYSDDDILNWSVPSV